MISKVENIGVDPMGVSPDNPLFITSDKLCSVDMAPKTPIITFHHII